MSTTTPQTAKPRERAETPQQLIEHIDRLMHEAEALLVGPVAGNAPRPSPDKLEQIKSRLSNMQDRLSAAYGETRRKVSAGARATDETIRAHPYESLAIAIGVGVLLGSVIGRASRR